MHLYGELLRLGHMKGSSTPASLAWIEELLGERALTTDTLKRADIADLLALHDEARARRYSLTTLRGNFERRFARLGGQD